MRAFDAAWLAARGGEEGADRAHVVYLACCGDETLYAGYTIDLTRRIAAHNAGKGARYTRGRGPVTAIAAWSFGAKGDALRAEIALKRLPRRDKVALAATQNQAARR